ncbi:MAG: lysophospholipid acyltransferase family protein, partial [Pirellulales bacterium]|nr:lysophospholipid acyltransferase family protein [Pirellulales bacterium]
MLRVVSGTANLLPQRAALALGSGAARIALMMMPSWRAEASRRIRQVFGEQFSQADVKRIVNASFGDLTWHLIEILRMSKLTPAWVERYVVFEDEDRQRLETSLELNRGVIIAVPHLANWDLAGVGLQRLGYPMTFIVRSQKNPLFDRHLNRLRGSLGSEVIERDDPLLVRKVVRSLRNGNVVAILIDLRARKDGLQVPFLGHVADIGRGVGLIARVAGCPVL